MWIFYVCNTYIYIYIYIIIYILLYYIYIYIIALISSLTNTLLVDKRSFHGVIPLAYVITIYKKFSLPLGQRRLVHILCHVTKLWVFLIKGYEMRQNGIKQRNEDRPCHIRVTLGYGCVKTNYANKIDKYLIKLNKCDKQLFKVVKYYR